MTGMIGMIGGALSARRGTGSANPERQYFQRRALQEIETAMRAESIEAEMAHETLAGLQLRRCAGASHYATCECRSCPLAHVCDVPHEQLFAA